MIYLSNTLEVTKTKQIRVEFVGNTLEGTRDEIIKKAIHMVLLEQQHIITNLQRDLIIDDTAPLHSETEELKSLSDKIHQLSQVMSIFSTDFKAPNAENTMKIWNDICTGSYQIEAEDI